MDLVYALIVIIVVIVLAIVLLKLLAMFFIAPIALDYHAEAQALVVTAKEILIH